MDGVSRAVEEGQLTISGQPFLVRKWTTNLPMLINDVKKVAIWVRLYGIPLEYWTPKGLSYIASAIETLLYADSITEGGKRLDFARISIEIKVDAECPYSISLTLSNGESMVINVEYSWKPLKCNVCQCFGHSTANCSFVPKLEGSSSSRKVQKDGSNKYSVLAHDASHEQDKRSIVLHEEGNLEKSTEGVNSEGKEKMNVASTSKNSQVTAASGIVPEGDGTSTSGAEDMENEASPTIVPFGGKLKVDEIDLRKKDMVMKSMNLGKKLAKLKKANSPPLLSK
ncbi:uncharacterized protein LOC123213711 [Mangifera indica]|uniref:uncharacterized protein LOC123213711 n=1 Tax=Mangifera indica TaxID=29780 RepID=UPI001CFB3159|nr:uncharacterized protein LOC123213711 [Mangifera indica]